MRVEEKSAVHAFYAEALRNGENTAEGLQEQPSESFVSALAAVDDQTPRTALDLGYGAGNHTMMLAQTGYTVTAVDQAPSETLLRRLVPRTDLCDKVSVHESLIEDFPIGGGFGIVVARDVLHYLAKCDVQQLLRGLVDGAPSWATHYLEVFTDISRGGESEDEVRIEGEADLTESEFRKMVALSHGGWEIEFSSAEHAEFDRRSGRECFHALRVTAVARRRPSESGLPEGAL